MRARYAVGVALAAALLAPTGVVTAQTPAPGTPAPAMKKIAAPLKGVAEVGYMMSAKRVGDKIVTKFDLKNLSATNSIVGLEITQYFYDKAGQPIQGTGDRQRLRTPLGPGEVTTLTLTSATVPGMQPPQHKFAQQYGPVKPKPLKSMKDS